MNATVLTTAHRRIRRDRIPSLSHSVAGLVASRLVLMAASGPIPMTVNSGDNFQIIVPHPGASCLCLARCTMSR
jgi:hypothetical protein